MRLDFKIFFEEDIKNWLLGRKEGDKPEGIIPPPGKSPEDLLAELEAAEKSGNTAAVRKAREAIEQHGYFVKALRFLCPRRAAR